MKALQTPLGKKALANKTAMREFLEGKRDTIVIDGETYKMVKVSKAGGYVEGGNMSEPICTNSGVFATVPGGKR